MGRKRRRFTDEFKAKVALAAVRGDKTASELASQFGIHANQVSTWKRRLLEGAAALFAEGHSRSPDESSAKEPELYEQIGRLKMEVEWLKTKSAELG
jgi:transposase